MSYVLWIKRYIMSGLWIPFVEKGEKYIKTFWFKNVSSHIPFIRYWLKTLRFVLFEYQLLVLSIELYEKIFTEKPIIFAWYSGFVFYQYKCKSIVNSVSRSIVSHLEAIIRFLEMLWSVFFKYRMVAYRRKI